jgi:hypothetical protein
MYSP